VGAAARLFQPLVLDIAEEARPEEGVGLLDIGQIRGKDRSFYLQSAILIYGTNLPRLANDEEFVAVADDLKTVGWVCLVDPLTKELRSSGSAAVKERDAEERDRDDAQER